MLLFAGCIAVRGLYCVFLARTKDSIPVLCGVESRLIAAWSLVPVPGLLIGYRGQIERERFLRGASYFTFLVCVSY